MNIRLVALATLLALAATSADSKPIQLKASLAGENQPFVGTWQAKKISDYSTRNYDNTVLVLMPDGNAMFKHCAKHLVGSTSSVSGTVLSDTVVGSIGDGELTLARPSFPHIREQTFKLDSAPYRENGQWYMVLDGTILRKLGANEKSDYAAWECP
jgi:hypothetical protein